MAVGAILDSMTRRTIATAFEDKSRLVLLILVAIGLALSGCLSDEPIGKADPKSNDSRLLGKWRSDDKSFPPFDDGRSVWLVEAMDNGTLTIHRQDRKGSTRNGARPTTAHVTQLASGTYLNLLTEEHKYLIAKYAFDGVDRVSLQFLDWNSLTNAINEQALPGVLKKEGTKMVPYVTATSAEWQVFLASEPPGLFGKPWVLVRPTPETTLE